MCYGVSSVSFNELVSGEEVREKPTRHSLTTGLLNCVVHVVSRY
jgi:hypothetical protein